MLVTLAMDATCNVGDGVNENELMSESPMFATSSSYCPLPVTSTFALALVSFVPADACSATNRPTAKSGGSNSQRFMAKTLARCARGVHSGELRRVLEPGPQRHLLDAEERDQPEHDADACSGEERGPDRVREIDPKRGGKPVDRRALARLAEPRRKALVDDHAHHGDTDGRADRAGELGERRCRAHGLAPDHVLHREDEHLHHRADPDPGDDH